MTRIFITLCGVILLLISCKTTSTSLIVGDSYNNKTDNTTLTILPYGNIVIPGQWTKTGYNSSSKQHSFIRESDSTFVSITKNPKGKYPFYKDSQTDFEFVTNFHKWDSDYRKEQGYKTEIIKENKETNYILWRILTDEVDNTFLYGLKNGIAYNFMVAESKMNLNEKIVFLEKMYQEN